MADKYYNGDMVMGFQIDEITTEYTIQKCDYFSSKVSCQSRLSAIKLIKEKLNVKQLRLFKTTCFGKLLSMHQIHFSGQFVHNLLLRKLQHPNSNEMWFALADGFPFRFSMQEFCLITGLNCAPYPQIQTVEADAVRDIFCRKMLRGSTSHSMKQLEFIFREATSDNDEDMVKLAMLYFLESVLLGKDQKTLISKEHIYLLDDIDAFNKYPWGRRCYNKTLVSMKKVDFQKKSNEYKEKNIMKSVKRNKKTRNSSAAYYRMSGFPYAFQIWAYEAIPSFGNAIAIKCGSVVPRILNWKTQSIVAVDEVKKLFDGTNILTIQTLQPTPTEQEEEYWLTFLTDVQPNDFVSSESVDLQNSPSKVGPDNVHKAIAPVTSFNEPVHAKGKHFCQACKNKCDDLEKEVKDLKKQVEGMNSKLDFLISNLLPQNKRPIDDDSSPSKDQGHIAVETGYGFSRAMEDDAIPNELHSKDMPPLDASLSGKVARKSVYDDEALSIEEIEKPFVGCYRLRKKGKQISSPFEPLFRQPKQPIEFCVFPFLDVAKFKAIKAWAEAPNDNVNDRFETRTGSFKRDELKILYTPSAWLADEHMNHAFYLLRKMAKHAPTLKMRPYTTTDSLFQQCLFARRRQLMNPKTDVWDVNDTCFKYPQGMIKGGLPWKKVEKVYMPFNHRDSHWVLVVVDFIETSIVLYDSLSKHIRQFQRWLEPLHTMLPLLLQKMNIIHESKNTHSKLAWKVTRAVEVPEQTSGGDCGIFVIKMAELMINGHLASSFKQENIAYCRQQLTIRFWDSRKVPK